MGSASRCFLPRVGSVHSGEVRTNRHILVALGLAALTLAVYWQATGFEFVNYDDHRYVTENTRVLNGLTIENVRWAFTTFEFSNWHPLTWLSHMLDVTLHGREPGGHHLTSIILHAINGALLMILLVRMTGAPWRSAMVAMLFALHPLHVESVAWVSERKDVLSTCFGLLTMLAYVRYAMSRAAPDEGRPGSNRRRSTLFYILTLLFFALSLMSKPMLVTLPFVLLVLDWWPLRRVRSPRDWMRLIIEKTPLAAMSVASCIITIAAQRQGEAVRDLTQVPLAQRLGNAVVAYSEYLWQTIWPADLIMFYPQPAGGWATGRIVIAIAALTAITVACAIASRRKNHAALAGWLWFLGTLVPVIGLVQVGAQSHADRYTYVPLIGVFIMVVWSVQAIPASKQRLAAILATAILGALACVTWVQTGYWRDSMTLATHALNVNEHNLIAQINLGNALAEVQRYDEAIEHLERATQIDPVSPQAWHNLGFAYAQAARREEAIEAYRMAITYRPDFADNYLNIGLLLAAAGQNVDARASLQKAAELAARAGDDEVRDRAEDALSTMPVR